MVATALASAPPTRLPSRYRAPPRSTSPARHGCCHGPTRNRRRTAMAHVLLNPHLMQLDLGWGNAGAANTAFPGSLEFNHRNHRDMVADPPDSEFRRDLLFEHNMPPHRPDCFSTGYPGSSLRIPCPDIIVAPGTASQNGPGQECPLAPPGGILEHPGARLLAQANNHPAEKSTIVPDLPRFTATSHPHALRGSTAVYAVHPLFDDFGRRPNILQNGPAFRHQQTFES
ncbi:hypothetical protein BDV93DRAFT_506989 [Ceratobasidium sp. AG-I]|nr:hypothetical protein BDV93DRAFT_506989 [Ceratobasidium sp. AG-I]